MGENTLKKGVLIFFLALLVRAMVIHFFPAILNSDDRQYFDLATGWASSHQYLNEWGEPALLRPPGYPYFLSLLISLFGNSLSLLYAIQAIIGASFCVMLYRLAQEIVPEKEAFYCGLIAAVYPSFFWYSRILLTENIALPLLALTMIFALRFVKNQSLSLGLALGISLGLSNLTRGASFLHSLLLGLVLFGFIFFQKKKIRPFLISLIVTLLIQIPWAYRNYTLFHQFIWVSANDGPTLLQSYYPVKENGKNIWGKVYYPPELAARLGPGPINEAFQSELFKKFTIEKLKQEPFQLIRYIPEKIFFLMIPRDYETFPNDNPTHRSFNWVYFLLLIPGLCGFVNFARDQPFKAIILATIPATVLIQTLIFYGCPRYRIPIEILIVIFAPRGLAACAAYAAVKWRESCVRFSS